MPSTSSPPPLVLISLPNQLSSPLALPSKLCYPTPLSLLSPFLFSKPLFSATCPPVLLVLWCQRFSGRVCSFLYTVFLTLEFIASRRLLSSWFVWPGLSRDVGLWFRACLRCQQSKFQTHVKSPVPERRFSHVHLDIVGPLSSSQGYSYILTMIHRTSR